LNTSVDGLDTPASQLKFKLSLCAVRRYRLCNR